MDIDRFGKVATLALSIQTALVTGWFSVYQFEVNRKQQEKNDEQKASSTALENAIKKRDSEHKNILNQTELTSAMERTIKDSMSSLKFIEDHQKRIELTVLKMRIDSFKKLENSDNNANYNLDPARDIPFYFALFAEQHEMLADIGANPDDMTAWVRIAMNSGAPKIKATGLQALNLVLMTRRDKATRIHTIDSLINLDRTIDSPELQQRLFNIYQNFLCQLNLEEADSDSESKAAVAKLTERTRSLSTRVAGFHPALPKVGETNTKPPAQLGCLDQTPNALPQATQVSQPLSSAAKQNIINIINTVAPVSKQNQPEKIAKFIDDLESTESSTRQAARSKLGQIGEEAIPPLIDLFENKPKIYRVRLGVVASLALMDPRTEMAKASGNRLASLVEMLHDPDPTIRGNAHELFASLLNPKTIASVQPAILAAMAKRNDDYSVARIAAIVSDWFDSERAQTLPPDVIKDIDTKLVAIKGALVPADQWMQARGTIDNVRQKISHTITASPGR